MMKPFTTLSGFLMTAALGAGCMDAPSANVQVLERRGMTAVLGSAASPAVDPDAASADQVAPRAVERCAHSPLVTQERPADRAAYQRDAAGWLTWMMALPFSTGPVADTTGASCGQGQHGRVWYLAGTTGGAVTRTCTIPANKQIFVPLINRWGVSPELDQFVPDVLAWFDESRAANCSLTLRLDGRDLLPAPSAVDAALYASVDAPFSLVINDDNWASAYGVPGGDTRGMTSGYYALFEPLSPGDHVLEIGGATCDAGAVDFSTAATYTLHVEDEHGHGHHGH